MARAMECAIRLGLLQQRGETEKEIAQAEVDRNFKKIEEVEVEVDVEAAVTAILVAKTEDLKLKAAILKRVGLCIYTLQQLKRGGRGLPCR